MASQALARYGVFLVVGRAVPGTGLLKWIFLPLKSAVLMWLLAVALLGSGQVQAFEFVESREVDLPLGNQNCSLFIYVEPSITTAFVRLSHAPIAGPHYYARGFQGGNGTPPEQVTPTTNFTTPGGRISVPALERCGLTNVQNLQHGVVGDNLAEASRVFISFDATDADGRRYSYVAEVVGATNTRVRAERTLIDDSPPAVSLSGVPSTVKGTGPITIGVRFSRAVTGLRAADLQVGNGTVALSGAGRDYSLTLTPDGNGDVTLTLPADAVRDFRGNGNAAFSTTIPYHATAPVVTLNAPTLVNSTEPFAVTVTFSEAVRGFEAADLQVSHGSVTAITAQSPSVYTLSVTPDGRGDITLALAANGVTNHQNIANLAAAPLTVGFNADAPSVLFDDVPTHHDGRMSFSIYIKFSEPVVGFDFSDIQLTNASLDTFNSSAPGNNVFLFSLSAQGKGDISVFIPAGAAQSRASGHDNVANRVVIPYAQAAAATADVVLSGAPDSITDLTPFEISATFNEAVSGFDASDVQVSHGRAAVSGSGKQFTLTITPDGGGDVSVVIPANAATGLSGNPSSRSNTLVVKYNIVKLTQQKIARYMLARLNKLASHQPDLTRFMQGEKCSDPSVYATENGGSMDSCILLYNTWAELTGSWDNRNAYALAGLGHHRRLNPHLMVGGMALYDYNNDSGNDASGEGWMVGPYFVARTPGQPLFVEGRLLYGRTSNEITPIGSFTDSFDTERWLVKLRTTGEYQVRSVTLMPHLDVTYTDDRQFTYTDTLKNTIPGQKVSLTQATVGLNFLTPIPIQSGGLNLLGGVSGIHSATTGGETDYNGLRGRTEIGLNYILPTGTNIGINTYYDGFGSDYTDYGTRLTFNFEF